MKSNLFNVDRMKYVKMMISADKSFINLFVAHFQRLLCDLLKSDVNDAFLSEIAKLIEKLVLMAFASEFNFEDEFKYEILFSFSIFIYALEKVINFYNMSFSQKHI